MTPNNGSLLLRAILAQPDEDTPRLMFADWLDESGKPAAHAWARFIREQIRAHREGKPDTAEAKALFTPHWRGWFGHLIARDPEGFMPSVHEQYRHPAIIAYDPLIPATEPWTANASQRLQIDGRCSDYYCWWLVQRGFVSVVRAHCSHWFRYGDTICCSQPVVEVILSTGPAVGEINPLRWSAVRTWNTSPDDYRFWVKLPAWAEERP